jgi:hypothetical protein
LTASSAVQEIAVGSAEWFAWLETRSAFRFDGAEGTFSARKEHRSNSLYWYAYRRHHRRLHNAYLGKPAVITADQPQTIAHVLSASAFEDHQVHHHPSVMQTTARLATKLLVPPTRTE